MTDPSSPRTIICLGTDWYSPLESSIRQITTEFRRRGSRVLWINPLPIRFPSVKRPDFRKKVINKAKTHTKLLRRPAPDVHVYSPLYLPVFTPLGMKINRILVSLQVYLVQMLLGFRSPLVLGSEFTCWYAMPAIRRHKFFFHFADKISAFREVASFPEKRKVLEDMEAEIIREADVSGCSSRLIHQHVLDAAAKAGLSPAGILYLPHAIDARVFEEARSLPDPADIAGLPRPIAGYYGSLTQANDKETFFEAAKAMPDWSFVFIGRTVGDYDELAALDNVHFLGPKPHADIPRYGRCFDVCFMGWLPHEWITNCFPLKTMEYLLLGKPIVCSCRIDEVAESFPGLIRFTEGAEGFARGLAEEKKNDTPALAEKRREAVGDFTWESYVNKVLAAFADPGERSNVR